MSANLQDLSTVYSENRETSAAPETGISAQGFFSDRRGDWLLNTTVLISVAIMLYASMRGHIFASIIFAARSHEYFKLIERPSIILAVMGTLMYGFRSILWMLYQAPAPLTEAEAPRLTVVIPAYNEGPMVAQSIDSVAVAFYPKNRLQIIAVDDGSRDDTWIHIQAAAARHPGVVETIRFEKNRGKRAALEAGFRRATGDIAVTIDSDSIIDPRALLAMAGAFRDAKVGAVAGKVLVYNRAKKLIPRMLYIRFLLSFDFFRAAQSSYGIVFCCPGALAGYRMSVVREVIDDWMSQSFLGVTCTYGEDRAMTNYILAKGYKSVYQRLATVYTMVPESYRQLCKMYLRWDRSAIREDIRLVRVLRGQPLIPRTIAAAEAILQNLRQPVGWTAIILLVILAIHEPPALLRALLAIAFVSMMNILYCLRDERSWRLVFGVIYAYFAMFGLFWIFPYALFTLRSRSWMTR